jgi:hypothetical protein
MAMTQALRAALKAHKRWADVFSLMSIVLVVGLLSVTAVLANYSSADLATRIGMYIVMASVIVVVCIWQAAAVMAAVIQNIITEQLDSRRGNGGVTSSAMDRGSSAQ